MARILIAGYGYLGTRSAARLVAAGHTVFGLRRHLPNAASGAGAGAAAAGVGPVVCDLTRIETLEVIPRCVDVLLYMVSADGRDDVAYREAYVDGLENLITVMKQRGEVLRRLLFVSSTGVYEQNGGEWVDEQTPLAPRGFAGRRLLEGERRAQDAPWPATVLRLAGIYGPGRALFVKAIRAGERRFRVDADRYLNLIHVDDACGAVAHLVTGDDTDDTRTNELYLGVDHEPIPKTELLRWLCREMGAREPLFEDEEMGSTKANKRCRNRRLLASGYRFLYPSYREGYRSLFE